MHLKDEIINNIQKMDIDELIYMKTIIRNIHKKRAQTLKKKPNKELNTIREILKDSNLSGEIESLRNDRI